MQHFFADRSWVQGDKIRLEGSDVNHMKNVLRMKEGEEVQVSDGTGNAYLCQIEGYEGDQAVLKIREKTEKDTELPSKIWLFQGLPKGDKMELIVQKAVELGVYGIVPFAAKRSVVRLDEKKAGKKQIRWQAIAKGAAEQSGRGLIPEVETVKTYAEALEFAKGLDVILVPYELEEAAAIDGCSPEGTFFRIILPLLKPVIVTVTILNGMWIWNDYLLPSLMLGQNGKVKTLPVAVQAFVGSYVKQWDLILTAALLAMIPMIIVFLLAQKQIMNGMVEGAIK